MGVWGAPDRLVMVRGARIAVAVAAGLSCRGEQAVPVTPAVVAAPATVAERMLAMLPQGAQVVVELDLARLRANPVVGEVVTRALAEHAEALPADVPAPPLADVDQVVLAAYGVGTAQAATLTVLAAPHELAGATAIAEGIYAVGPPAWVEQIQQRVALATTGEARFAITAAPELLALRRRAMPEHAPGASLRVSARLPFDARIALARQTGLDAAPAQVSAWADIADDLALVVDCDASDPGDAKAKGSDATRRLEAMLRGALAAASEQPTVRALGLPSAIAGARLVTRGSWVRMIVAIGPARLRRVVERAAAQLLDAPKAPEAPEADRATPASAPSSRAAPPPGDHPS
jgi:hypothetical protein